jgi:quercetin dioxygenase-like cupin family protein
MQRQNLFADSPWDSEERGPETGLVHRSFWRPDGARMGATLWDLAPGAAGMRWHMHYGAEEMFFVLSGRPVFRTPDGEEELAPGDFVFCPEGRAGLHAYSNPHDEPARILAMSAGGFPDVVAYPEHNYAWVATRVPELPAEELEDPGIIARFDFDLDRPDDRVD